MLTTRLLILDVDGILTDGTKVYDKDHNVLSKRFMCKDFSAIKRFMAAGIKVIMISGDSWNRDMAKKRNIDFYCTRDVGTLNLDKSIFKFKSSGIDLSKFSISPPPVIWAADEIRFFLVKLKISSE